MGESNVEAASVISDIVRTIFSVLDRPAYWLLGIMYQLFFNVASADFYDYEAKYTDDAGTTIVVPAELPKYTIEKIKGD